jgi:hypothetical protein
MYAYASGVRFENSILNVDMVQKRSDTHSTTAGVCSRWLVDQVYPMIRKKSRIIELTSSNILPICEGIVSPTGRTLCRFHALEHVIARVALRVERGPG